MMAQTATKAGKRAAPESREEDRQDVQAFLDDFARKLTSGDARAVAGLWATPAYVIGDDMALAVSTADEVEKFFAPAKKEYNERGIADTRAEILELNWLTDRIALVSVRWPYLDGKGKEKGSESSTYTLRRDDSGAFKLHVSVMQGVATP
jgi:hypothetical protein